MKRTPLKRKTPLKQYTPLRSGLSIKAKSRLKGRQKTAKKLKEPYHSIFTENIHACQITGDTRNVEPHHIFQGEAGKTLSEKYGFILPLRSDWHRTGNYAIHKDRRLNIKYKLLCQEYYIKHMGKSREEWNIEFGRWWSIEDAEK